MKVELKNLKVHRDMSQETECFSATVYIDGIKAGTVQNQGCGGANDYDFRDRALFQRFEAFCKAQPPIPADPDTGYPELKMCPDLYIGLLMERLEIRKQIVRWTTARGGRTLFRLQGDKKGTWRQLMAAYSEKAVDFIKKKYGSQLVMIANENIDAAVEADLKSS